MIMTTGVTVGALCMHAGGTVDACALDDGAKQAALTIHGVIAALRNLKLE